MKGGLHGVRQRLKEDYDLPGAEQPSGTCVLGSLDDLVGRANDRKFESEIVSSSG